MNETVINPAFQEAALQTRRDLEALHDRLQAEKASTSEPAKLTVEDWIGFIHNEVTPLVAPLSSTGVEKARWAILGRSRSEGEDLVLGYDINSGKLLLHKEKEGSEPTTTEIGNDPASLENLSEHDKSLLHAAAIWGKDRAVRVIARGVVGEPNSKVINGWVVDDPPLK